MAQEPALDEAGTSTPGGFDGGVVTVARTISDLVREGLAGGTDRASLESLLGSLADRLGFEIMIIGRHEADDGSESGAMQVLASHGLDPGSRGASGYRFPVDGSQAGRAFASGRPVVTRDPASDPGWIDVSGGRSRAGVCLPMRLPGRVWGVLGIESSRNGAFRDRDVVALQPLADTLAWILESLESRREATLRAERERRLRRGLEASAAVITAGLEASDLGGAFERMVREIRDQLEWDAIAVLLLGEDGNLEVVAQHGYDPDVATTRFPTSRGILGLVATTGRPYLASDTQGDPYYADVVQDTRSELCVPLRLAGRVRGVMNAESPTPGRFTVEDLDIATGLADQMALVIHNVELLSSEKERVARLHDLDRMKSRLLTIASHELRTPLTVVMGFAEVLSEHMGALDDDKAREYAGAIARQAGSLSELVDQMLLATQIEQGQLGMHPSVVNLAEAVTAALNGGREQHIEVLDGIEGVRVVADPFRLGQVLRNLFDNAIKYAAESGRIQVDARIVEDTARILLRDEGPGVPGYERERVFEPFHQIGEHGVTGRRGVGLGLAVARDLVALMDGQLRLFSAEGYGATFTIDLPAG